MRQSDPTTAIRDRYDASAPRYDGKIRLSEWLLFGGGRKWVADNAAGRVLEVAVGTGRNLPYYPSGASVTGIDLSGAMISIARTRVSEQAAALQIADAQHLPFPDNCFDTVVATLALCSIPDDAAATREMARVLRPDGTLVLLEHVRSPQRFIRFAQRLLEPMFLRLEGDHLLREPEKRVAEAGLRLEFVQRSKLGIVLRLLARKAS